MQRIITRMEETMQNDITKLSDAFISELEKSLPKLFDRDTASKSLGGVLSAKTLAHADSQGTGPELTMKLGRKVLYERASFLEWLRKKMR